MFPHVSDDACRGLKMERSALVRRVRLIYDPSRAELRATADVPWPKRSCSISFPSFSRLS
jgi:hypothetical protein